MEPHVEKMQVARAKVAFQAPYFTSVLYGLIFVPAEVLPGAMAVSTAFVCQYLVEWANVANVDELAADIYHEIHHIVREHFKRTPMMGRLDLWGLATDLAINPDIVAGGWKLCLQGKYRAIMPKDFGLPDGLSAEEYYELLLKEEEKGEQSKVQTFLQETDDSGQGKSGSGEGEEEKGDGNKEGSGGGDKSEGEQGKGRARGIACGKCGSLNSESSTPEKDAQLDKEYGRSEAEKKQILVQVAHDMRQYIQQGRGTIPGSLVEVLEALEERPLRVNWREETNELLQHCTGRIASGGHDFSLARPSKRSYLRGILRPGLVDYEPEVAIALDTSGSMGKPQLVDAVIEIANILEMLGISEVWFCEADAGIAQEWVRVGPGFFRDLAIKGRGGTDFRPVFESARKLSPLPDLLCYLTDGDGTAPEVAPPEFDTIWGIVKSYFNRAPCNWGHVVYISDDPNRPNMRVGDDPSYAASLQDDDDDDAA